MASMMGITRGRGRKEGAGDAHPAGGPRRAWLPRWPARRRLGESGAPPPWTARGNRSVPRLGGGSRSASSGRSGPSCYSARQPAGPNIPDRGSPNTEFPTPPRTTGSLSRSPRSRPWPPRTPPPPRVRAPDCGPAPRGIQPRGARNPVSAEPRVPPKHDANPRPCPTQPLDQQRQYPPGGLRTILVRTTKAGHQQLLTAEHVRRHETVAVMGPVEEGSRLMTVHRIVSRAPTPGAHARTR